nr:MAG TPA: hypothetical protein [Microviridae sp.]
MLQQPINSISSIENLLPSVRKQFATLHDERISYIPAPISIFVFINPLVEDAFDEKGVYEVYLCSEGALYVKNMSRFDAMNHGLMPSVFLSFPGSPKYYKAAFADFFSRDYLESNPRPYNLSENTDDYQHTEVCWDFYENAVAMAATINKLYKEFVNRVTSVQDRIQYFVDMHYRIREQISDFLRLHKIQVD